MESKIKFKPNPEYRLMDQVREVLRYYHYAYRTEQSYSSWILQYIKFYGGKTHPKDMGKNEDAGGSCKAAMQYEGKARPDGKIVIRLWP